MTNFNVSDDLKVHLESMASSVRKSKGTVLFHRGEKSTGMYLIREGRVALSLDHANGNYSTRTVGPGCVIGVPGTLSGAGYSLTAKALEDCHLGFVPREKLLEFLRHNPENCFQLVEMLSKEIAEMRSAIRRKRSHIAQSA
jgi:CRP-like cAMP-binding protein